MGLVCIIKKQLRTSTDLLKFDINSSARTDGFTAVQRRGNPDVFGTRTSLPVLTIMTARRMQGGNDFSWG
jgi:hypothetical protein